MADVGGLEGFVVVDVDLVAIQAPSLVPALSPSMAHIM
jgi:hypothetical protein